MIEFALIDQMGAIEIGIHCVLRALSLGSELLAHPLKGVVNLCRNQVHDASEQVPVSGVYAAD